MASRMTGNKKLRKTLRRLPDGISQDVVNAVNRTAEAIKQDMISMAPVDEGDLVRSIDTKRGRDGLTSVIGPGAKSVSISKNPFQQAALGKGGPTAKDRRFQFFKAYWIEFGTKPKNGHPGITPQPFVQPAFDLNVQFGRRQIQAAISRALQRASL